MSKVKTVAPVQAKSTALIVLKLGAVVEVTTEQHTPQLDQEGPESSTSAAVKVDIFCSL
jgi:hypothetical protein